MKLVLNSVPWTSFNSGTYSIYNNLGHDSYNYWGKCCLNEDGKSITIMQDAVTCKDYVVDTYARDMSSGGYSKYIWTKQQRLSPTVYITLDKKSMLNLTERVKTLLNPYEERHGFIPSEVHYITEVELKGVDVTKEKGYDKFLTGMVVVKYDPKWMINVTAMSMYLSCLRHFFKTELVKENQDQIIFDDGKTKYKFSHNEQHYYYGLKPQFRKIVDYYYNNPKLIIEDISEKYGESGNALSGKYELGRPQIHGEAGFFTAMSYLYNAAVCRLNDPAAADQYVLHKIWKACGINSKAAFTKTLNKYKKDIFKFPNGNYNYENADVFLVKEIDEYLERQMQSV